MLLSQHLEELNLKLDKANGNAREISIHSKEYCDLLRQYMPQAMTTIRNEQDQRKKAKLLQSIFPVQRHLMSIRIIANQPIDNDLWEIAQDFDNDDPLAYDYLLNKIDHEEYVIQSGERNMHNNE